MPTTINTWPPIPSFIYSAMSEAWRFLSLCTSPYILHPVKQLGFIKGTEYHNKLYYQPAQGLILLLFLLFFSLVYLSVYYFTFVSLASSILSHSASVPTYYWWVDFTSHWCGEGTVEYGASVNNNSCLCPIRETIITWTGTEMPHKSTNGHFGWKALPLMWEILPNCVRNWAEAYVL